MAAAAVRPLLGPDPGLCRPLPAQAQRSLPTIQGAPYRLRRPLPLATERVQPAARHPHPEAEPEPGEDRPALMPGRHEVAVSCARTTRVQGALRQNLITFTRWRDP